MATPKKRAGGGIAEGLLKEAAGEAAGEGEAEEMAEEEEYDSDSAMKDAFLEMAKAIRDGDDEAAFAAYQECQGKG